MGVAIGNMIEPFVNREFHMYHITISITSLNNFQCNLDK